MSTKASRAALQRRTADRLHSAAIRLLRSLRRRDLESGLSGPRLSALSVIVYGGPLSLGALANAEQVRPPTMSRLVAALEEAELVRRETDPRDRRAIRLSATAEGKRVLELGRRRRIESLSAHLEGIDEIQLTNLEAAADTLLELLAKPATSQRGTESNHCQGSRNRGSVRNS